MSDQFLTALIAAGISLTVSILTIWTARWKAKQDQGISDRAIAQKFAEELLRHRLRLYPGGFIACEGVGKGDSDDPSLLVVYRDAQEQLRKWKIGEVDCVISTAAEDCYQDLLDALKKNPARGSRFDRDQIDKLYQLRQKFRGALRRDLGIFHASSKLRIEIDS